MFPSNTENSQKHVTSKSVKKVRKFISKIFSELNTGIRDVDDDGEDVRFYLVLLLMMVIMMLRNSQFVENCC